MQPNEWLTQTGTWQDLDVDNPAIKVFQEQQEQKRLDDAELFHRVFMQHADGAELLKRMVDTFLLRQSAEDASLFHAGFREGQESIIKMILFNIRFAEQGGKKV